MSDILKRQLDETALPCNNCHIIPLICMYSGYMFLECPECRKRSQFVYARNGRVGARDYIKAEFQAIESWNERN